MYNSYLISSAVNAYNHFPEMDPAVAGVDWPDKLILAKSLPAARASNSALEEVHFGCHPFFF